ncbi:Mitotic check point protein BUB2 [Nakaseomyces glabratus]|nr:Mitotic check point protein BUB2 [Nakaseomyces glabratus]KTB20604.1 Mitotic check point protein BUB2 [Nakaseomyces glabratus]KTB24567.1 Mitotic check point protein BUB2 [Nakaseomyces glabratus]
MEKFISHPPLLVHTSLSQLRYLILSEGIPVAGNDKRKRSKRGNLSGGDEVDSGGSEADTHSQQSIKRLRCYVWSILSRTSMERCSQKYLALLQLGPPETHILQKIKNDTSRTLQTDPKFRAQVSEDALLRCLSCFAWEIERKKRQAGEGDTVDVSAYVQGMNVLLAPLLYSCPSEAMAYQLFSTMCKRIIPAYLTRSLAGAQNGARLLDACLWIVDPKLSKYLGDNLLPAEIYGMPSILTLSSCNKPLDQVCRLWDFMFAYGFHMNVLFVVAQLVSIRSKIFESESPMNMLRQLPEFDADEIIRLGVGFVAKIPPDLYDLLIRHLTDPDIVIAE